MRKSSAIMILICCLCFFLGLVPVVHAQDAAATADQVAGELTQSGVITQKEADEIKSPLKNMAEKGAGKQDLKNAVIDLSSKGVKAEELKQSVNSMNDLVNAGESPREAGNVVSRAAAQARAQGLKGKDLAAKVHEAVRQRKQQRNEAKKKEKEKEKEKEKNIKKDKAKGKGR